MGSLALSQEECARISKSEARKLRAREENCEMGKPCKRFEESISPIVHRN
jgi:hypothetical protein